MKRFITDFETSTVLDGYKPKKNKITWVADTTDENQFIQVNFDAPRVVKKLKVAPVTLKNGEVATVTRFKVLYKDPESESEDLKVYESPDGKTVSF